MVISTLSLFVAILTIFAVVCLSFFCDLLLTLVFESHGGDLFLVFLFGIIFVKMRKPLNHRVNFLVIVAHKHFLERSLRRQIKSFQKIGLSPAVIIDFILEIFKLLFGLKRQRVCNGFGNGHIREDTLLSFAVNMLVVPEVFGVFILL